MDKTEFLKMLIKETGLNMKVFSEKADIPYTTLRSMLDRGVENASVNNVIKICKALNISVEMLYEMENINNLSKEETILLDNFNKLNDIGKKEAYKRVSELTEMTRYTFVEPLTVAAHDDYLTDEEKAEMDRKILEELNKMNK